MVDLNTQEISDLSAVVDELAMKDLAYYSSSYQLGSDILGASKGDNCGYSVSINAAGDIVAIGSPYFNNKGHTRVWVLYENIDVMNVNISGILNVNQSVNVNQSHLDREYNYIITSGISHLNR